MGVIYFVMLVVVLGKSLKGQGPPKKDIVIKKYKITLP